MPKEDSIFWRRTEDVLMITLEDTAVLRSDYNSDFDGKTVKERFQLANFNNRLCFDGFKPDTVSISYVEFLRELRSISVMFGSDNLWYNQFFYNRKPLIFSVTDKRLNSSEVDCPVNLVDDLRKKLVSPVYQYFIKECARLDRDLAPSLSICLSNLSDVSYL